MKTTCKFYCSKVAKLAYDGQEEVTLNAVYGGSSENKSFAEATPSGSMTFTVSNSAVIGKFTPGKEYYVDIYPVPEVKA